jgi:hypothetical protein
VEASALDEIGVEAMRQLAARTDADAMAELITADIAARVWPEHTRDPDFLAAMQLSVRDNVRAIVALFAGRLTIAAADPRGAFGFADLTAEMGIPVSELESAYWVGVQSFWRLWFAQAREQCAGTAPLDELVGPPTELLFEYIIHILGAVVGRYDAARAEILRNQEDRRRAALNQILDGELTQATQDLENVLGYRLRGAHLCVVLEVEDRAKAERAVAELITGSSARGSMLMLRSPGIWAAWLALTAPLDAATRIAVTAAAAATGLPIAVGAPGNGVTGLRRTWLQAFETARLRRRFAGFGDVLWFAEVRLELLMLGDELTARQFVADELGELAGDDERAARTRETLLAWLSTGSQSAAATRLGVHENTVRQRIRYAEEVLGEGLSERRAEVLAALRLHPLFSTRPDVSG